jgi:hypothetical protein
VPFALLVTGLVVGGLVLLLVLNTASAANEVRRHDLAAQDASIAAQVQELRNEVAASAAPGNLERAAAELGMVPAGNPAFLVVGANGKVQVMGSPAQVVPTAVAHQQPRRHKPKPAPTTNAAETTAAKSTATTTSAAKSTAAKATGHAGTTSTAGHESSTPHPTPTPTPTPTVTLPGGNR